MAPPTLPAWEMVLQLEAVRNVQSGRHYTVCADGSLAETLVPAVAANHVWVPCCVVRCSATAGHIPRQEDDDGTAAANTNLFLVGPWRDVAVDPSVWGWGKTDVLSFTVKAATERRIRLRAAAEGAGWYNLRHGQTPALWHAPPEAPTGSSSANGLELLRSRWAASHASRLAGNRRRAADYTVEPARWMQARKRPRLSVRERLAGAAAAPPAPFSRQLLSCPAADDTADPAAPPPPAHGSPSPKGAWSRLREADLPRITYTTCWRILHGCLYVGGFLCHTQVLSPSEAFCLHPACSQQQLDDLQHVFVECPAVAPAAAWLCSLFAAAAGVAAPPATPRVLLADDEVDWHPEKHHQFLWTHLRATYLHAVWVLYCRRRRNDQPLTAAAVSAMVVAAIQAAIRRDWQRVTTMPHAS